MGILSDASVLIISVLLGLIIHFGLLITGIFSDIPILFYRGMATALFGALLHWGLLFVLSRALVREELKRCSRLVRLPAVAVVYSAAVVFLIVLPVSIDRSVTIFLLGELERAGSDGLSHDELQERLIKHYVIQLDAVGRRMDEQEVTETVQRKEGRYVLSANGSRLMKFSRSIAPLYGARTEYLQGVGEHQE